MAKKQKVVTTYQTQSMSIGTKIVIRVSYVFFLCIFSVLSVAALFIIETKDTVFESALTNTSAPEVAKVDPFPLGVNPAKETITENPSVDTFFNAHITATTKDTSRLSWWQQHITAKLALFSWYQNLASPISRILVVEPGERKEEVVDNFGDILNWDTAEREAFALQIASTTPTLREGKFFPSNYVVTNDATPEEVATEVLTRFNTEIASRYTKEIEAIVPLEDTMIIASLLEREAYDFEDMRYISGVIWNRLFAGMNLQIDASLQYAKANEGGTKWWPVPRPADKYIDSPFNTYENKGLPPAPISNPSPEAILAALNPKATECIFYFHDQNGGFHCTKTYEEHVANLKAIYGKGR